MADQRSARAEQQLRAVAQAERQLCGLARALTAALDPERDEPQLQWGLGPIALGLDGTDTHLAGTDVRLGLFQRKERSRVHRLFSRLSRTARAISIIAFAVAAMLAGATSAQAQGPSGPPAGAPEPLPVREMTERAARERREQLATRATPAARAQRLASRTAFAGQDRATALDLLRSKHKNELEVSWPPAGLRGTDPGVSFEDDYTARLARGPDGSARVAVTTLPLRGGDALGRLKPLDLEFETRGTAFAPRVAAQPLSIGGSGRAQVGDRGVAVRPVGMAATATPSAEGTSVVWPNAWRDTDFFWRADPAGARSFMHVRSAESPEAFALEVSVPAGAQLVTGQSGDPVRVMQGDEQLAVITAPLAWDADGERVPTSFRVSGNTLTLDVAHRDADALYPLIVDPAIITERYSWYTSNGGDSETTGWKRGFDSPDSKRWSLYWDRGPIGTGLYNRRDSGSSAQFYRHDERGFWYIEAPGEAWISEGIFYQPIHSTPDGGTTCVFW